MADDIHPVVEFLAKRMASHPEEFSTTHIQGGRWGFVLDQIGRFTTDEEKTLLFSKVRDHVFEMAHLQVLAELLEMEEPSAFGVPKQEDKIVFDLPVEFRKGFKSV